VDGQRVVGTDTVDLSLSIGGTTTSPAMAISQGGRGLGKDICIIEGGKWVCCWLVEPACRCTRLPQVP
jgi:hypothetical protein